MMTSLHKTDSWHWRWKLWSCVMVTFWVIVLLCSTAVVSWRGAYDVCPLCDTTAVVLPWLKHASLCGVWRDTHFYLEMCYSYLQKLTINVTLSKNKKNSFITARKLTIYYDSKMLLTQNCAHSLHQKHLQTVLKVFVDNFV